MKATIIAFVLFIIASAYAAWVCNNPAITLGAVALIGMCIYGIYIAWQTAITDRK
jgi:hypothetical protein